MAFDLHAINEQVYIDNGFESRLDYLTGLSEEYGDHVFILANVLGPEEDFDGLVTSLEDHEEFEADIAGYID